MFIRIKMAFIGQYMLVQWNLHIANIVRTEALCPLLGGIRYSEVLMLSIKLL